MRVLFFSCIANSAADHYVGKMNHEEVIKAMENSGERINLLITSCVEDIIRQTK